MQCGNLKAPVYQPRRYLWREHTFAYSSSLDFINELGLRRQSFCISKQNIVLKYCVCLVGLCFCFFPEGKTVDCIFMRWPFIIFQPHFFFLHTSDFWFHVPTVDGGRIWILAPAFICEVLPLLALGVLA